VKGWQQFVVHARDQRGDPVTDYLIDALRSDDKGNWVPLAQMYTDVHAYAGDQSFRSFHIRLPNGISEHAMPLQTALRLPPWALMVAICLPWIGNRETLSLLKNAGRRQHEDCR